MRDRGGDVGLDAGRGRPLHVLHEGEVVVALADAGRPPEVVDRHRVVAALGEAEGELLVEAVEAAHVREYDDARPRRLVRDGGERGQLVPVRGA